MTDMTAGVIVVAGVAPDGRPHAARFADADEPLARRAAQALGYQVIHVTTPDGLELAARLRVGQVYRTGKGFAPAVNPRIYDALIKLAAAVTRGRSVADKTAELLPGRHDQTG